MHERDQNAPSSRRILSLDGGGIRCLLGIEILVALESRLAELTGDSGRRISQHFDLVAGTSGGAIVATAIALGAPMVEIRDFVIANARAMFAPARWYTRYHSWYDKSALERNMKDWFGAETTLGSDRLKSLLMVVMRNWSTDSPWIVSNNPRARFNDRALDDCNLDIPLWQLARASAAAPAFYAPQTMTFGRRKPYDFVFVDGGLTAFLNPAFKAFQYATTSAYGLDWATGESRMTVVSIGSGEARHPRHGNGDSTLVDAVLNLPTSMLQATVREQDLLCRTFGRCRTGHVIDLELGDLCEGSTAVEPRLFGYHRLDPPLTRDGLKALGCHHVSAADLMRIDAVDQLAAFSEIGRRYAAQVVDRVALDCCDPPIDRNIA